MWQVYVFNLVAALLIAGWYLRAVRRLERRMDERMQRFNAWADAEEARFNAWADAEEAKYAVAREEIKASIRAQVDRTIAMIEADANFATTETPPSANGHANADAAQATSREVDKKEIEAAALHRLKLLTQDYAAIRHPELNDRVRARMKKSDQMLTVVSNENIDSVTLARWVEAEPAKELVLPLATLIAAHPSPGDAKRLFDAVDRRIGTQELKGDSKFIMYHVLLAIIALRDNGRLPTSELNRARAIAEACRHAGDSDLRGTAERVLELIGPPPLEE